MFDMLLRENLFNTLTSKSKICYAADLPTLEDVINHVD